MNIALIGTFDLESLGDTMFPKFVVNELKSRIQIDNVVLFSPNEIEEAYNNNGHVYSFKQLNKMNDDYHFDFVIIVGGELLHFKPIEYKINGKIFRTQPGELWKLPIEFARKNNIKVIINLIGVPYEFNKFETEILCDYLQYVSYISVRDKFSKMKLINAGIPENKIFLSGDGLLLFNLYYKKESLAKIREELGLNLSDDYLVVQYDTKYKLNDLAKELNNISDLYNLQIVLLSVNYCHNDEIIMRDLLELSNGKFFLIDKFLQPVEIMSIISGAKFFLGTSLHGNVTALSYGIKCLALDMYSSFISKIDGLYDLFGLGKYLISEPKYLLSAFGNLISDFDWADKINNKLLELQQNIKSNYDNISKIMTENCRLEFKCKANRKCNMLKSFIEIDSGLKKQIGLISFSESDFFSLKFEFDNLINSSKIYWSMFVAKPIIIKKLSVESVGVKNIEVNCSKCVYKLNDNYVCLPPKFSFEVVNVSNFKNIRLKISFSLHTDNEFEIYTAINSLLSNKSAHIELLLDSERKLSNELKDKSLQLQNLLDKENELNNEVDNLNLQLRNKTGHINLLLESDRELHNIKNSRSWKLANKIAKITRVILPIGSKRRLIAKVIFKFLKSPILFIKKANAKRIKNFFKILKQEGVSAVSKRIDECLISPKNESNEIKVIDIVKNPTKTLYDYEKISFDTFEDVQVSIIIPVYNEFDYTYNCLKTIKNNSGNINYEIIIADDCSDDLTMDIEKVISGIKVIRNIENMRFLKNCNNAAKFARGKFILFLNNDTQVQKNWLLPLIELFEKDKQIGLVGSKLVYPDGRLQEAGGIFWNDASAWNYGNKSDPNLSEFNYVKEVDYISGASILISKKLWNEIGGFDERFSPAYYEDSDLAFEVRKHGYKVMYQPLSVVVHFEGISNGTDLNSGQKSYQISNQKKFYDKWKDVLEKENFKNAENLFVARDRTRNKKTIVFIDHYVPTFDKDAGSKTVYQYIKLFVEHGFNVKLIGDNFYQAQPYSTIFQQMGVEVLYGIYYKNNWKKWIKDNCKYFDFFFLNRPHISLKYVDFIRENTSAKIMYYGHDLHFLREYREYELTGDILCKENFKVWKQKELSLMKKVDYVYYPSIVEKNAIKEIDKNINVKVIPAYIFDGIKYSGYETAKRKDLIFIGGFSHKPNLDGVFWFVGKIFPKVKKIISDIKIYILGSNVPEKLKNISDESIIVHGFVTDEQLNEFYSNCRISVVPLRYGAGIKGKVIEAMKNGVPVVTTSIGAEGIIGAENILSIEDDETKFADAIINLYNNYEKLEEISKKSFDYIVDNFSSKSVLQIIKEDFNIS